LQNWQRGKGEMSDLEGWEYKKIEDLALLDKEKLGEDAKKDFSFYYIDISSVSEGKLRLPFYKISFSEAPSRARKVVRRGDVLMSMVRPNLKAFAYFDHTDDDSIASTGFAVLSAKDQVDAKFVLYSILSEYVTPQIETLVVGSNYPAINLNAVRGLQVLVPSFAEQTKIAEILSTLDKAIEQTEALIAKQQRIKAGLMQDLLTRGIDEHGNLRSEQTHKFKDSSLGRIPMEWDLVPLISFASRSPDSFVNGPFGSDLLASELQVEGVPVIYIRDIRPGLYQRVSTVHVTQTKANHLAACNVHCGDILISKVGDPPCDAALYTHQERAIITQDVIRIRPSNEVEANFLCHLLNSHVGRKAVKEIIIQGTRARVSLTEFKTLKLPKPHREEQLLIADALESVAQDIQQGQICLDKLKLLKTALMQDLLSGKKRVTSLLIKTELPAL